MKITADIELKNYKFTAQGAKETVGYLTLSEIDRIEDILEDAYPDGMTDSNLEDIFCIERDTLAEWLGYDSFKQIMNRNADDMEDDEDFELGESKSHSIKKNIKSRKVTEENKYDKAYYTTYSVDDWLCDNFVGVPEYDEDYDELIKDCSKIAKTLGVKNPRINFGSMELLVDDDDTFYEVAENTSVPFEVREYNWCKYYYFKNESDCQKFINELGNYEY